MITCRYKCEKGHEDTLTFQYKWQVKTWVSCWVNECRCKSLLQHSVADSGEYVRLGPSDEQKVPSTEETDKAVAKIIEDARSQLNALAEQCQSDKLGVGPPEGEPAPLEQKQVECAMARMSAFVSSLEERINALIIRVWPVLLPAAPTNPSGEDKDAELSAVAPLADAIHGLANRLTKLDGIVQKIVRERLEL